MRWADCLTVLALVTGLSELAGAQTAGSVTKHLAEFSKRTPKATKRIAVQRAMVRAIQKGRIKAARDELEHLLRYQAYAAYNHRSSLVAKLQARIHERRTIIRELTQTID